MTVYGTEELDDALSGVCHTTFRAWEWTIIMSIADVNNLRFTLQLYKNESYNDEKSNVSLTD